MPWNQNNGGGGPWGQKGGGPWGQKGGGGGPWGQRGGGGGGGGQPPSLDELIRQLQERFKGWKPGGFGGGGGGGGGSGGGGGGFGWGAAAVAAVLVGIWVANGFYRVQPEEVGVELIFGRYHETTRPGLNFNWPAPIGEVQSLKLTRVNRVDVGFRGATSDRAADRDMEDESLMLTGDENIVDIDFTVLWRISDPLAFAFNTETPESTVKDVAESAMREVIGQSTFQYAVTQGRQEIEGRVRALMQQTLDSYGPESRPGGVGAAIVQVQLQKVDPPREVIDAFRDVQKARADQERFANEAQAYRNKIVPEARGEAERIRQAAQGYKDQVIAQATGEAGRFTAIHKEYDEARAVTRERLYLDTMARVLGGMNKLIVDEKGGGAVTPYLPLPDLARSFSGGDIRRDAREGGSQ